MLRAVRSLRGDPTFSPRLHFPRQQTRKCLRPRAQSVAALFNLRYNVLHINTSRASNEYASRLA